MVFVQVIQGQVADASKVKAAPDRWAQELAPRSIGWLGTTAGVTEDGRFIELARFESEEAARRNSDRVGPGAAELAVLDLGQEALGIYPAVEDPRLLPSSGIAVARV